MYQPEDSLITDKNVCVDEEALGIVQPLKSLVVMLIMDKLLLLDKPSKPTE